ncbi:MAG: DUF4202 domain-containing protein [Methyloligellaceae bacterium]
MTDPQGSVDTEKSDKFLPAVKLLQAVHAEDPNKTTVDGAERPYEEVYAERMSEVLDDLYPNSSELLSLAAVAQHLGRWKVLRSDYPEGRTGYFQWRNEQKRMHAEHAGEIMIQCGYSVDDVRRVKSLIRKEKFKQDPEAQALEDVACVVFMKYYFDDFLEKYKYDDEKVINIIQKTWAKMSETGHQGALKLKFDDYVTSLVQRALAG